MAMPLIRSAITLRQSDPTNQSVHRTTAGPHRIHAAPHATSQILSACQSERATHPKADMIAPKSNSSGDKHIAVMLGLRRLAGITT